MNKTAIAIAVVAASLISGATQGGKKLTKEERLSKCRSINTSIESLEQQRRNGGSARQMDGWKRRLHKQQDAYSRFNCRSIRRKL